MKRKNLTRNALFTSIISLLLCVSMLVGTTFAWFTDEVTSGLNEIIAGNLDIELYANGRTVGENTKLFDDVTLWEPGAVVYENLQVANVGTLDLKYQMTLNIANENSLDGHKLSEVLKVAVIDKIEGNPSRATVLAAAKAAVGNDQGIGALSNFYQPGVLAAGATSDEKAVVIFWDPNDNATDNLYNAKNGRTTSDGEPLHIEFGVKLLATQQVSEKDSFGNDYDQSSSILPKATVNNTGAKTVPVLMGYDEDEIELDTSFQFLPNESADDAVKSEYKDWHADYVVTASRKVPANSMALAGYYEAWCGDNGWVVLTSDADISANEEVRLVAGLMGGNTVSYEEICEYGNDGVGFLCGATDLSGANAGTTITVELRMYEVDPESSSLSTTDSETGYYEVIGRYTYTFPAAEVSNMAELDAALKAGSKVIDAKGADLGDFNYSAKFTDGAVIKNAKFTYFYGGNVEGTVTFENCEFVSVHSYSANFDSGNGKLVFNKCLFDGWSSFGTAITGVEMNNCSFQKSYNYGILRFYQNAVLNNCTFADSFEGVDTNQTDTIVKINNCTGVAGKIFNNGANVGTWIVDGQDISATITSW